MRLTSSSRDLGDAGTLGERDRIIAADLKRDRMFLGREAKEVIAIAVRIAPVVTISV